MLSLSAVAQRNPDGIALRDAGQVVSFANLFDKAEATAAALDLGTDSAVPRAFVAHNDVATVALIFALLERSIAALPLNPRLTESEQSQLVTRAGARLVAPAKPLPQEVTSNLPAGWEWQECPLAAAESEAPAPAVVDRPKCWTAPRKTQLLIATSGSTAKPKLVCLSHRALHAAAQASVIHLGLGRHDRWLLSLNLAHIGGISILLRCLVAEATVVLAEPNLPARAMLTTIEQAAVTIASFVPTQLEMLLADTIAPAQLTSLRAVLLGGARAPQQLVARARAAGLPILTTYGLSEAGSQVTVQPLADLANSSPSLDAGLPLPGVEVRIDHGVICVRGASLFDGYFGEMGSPLDNDGWFHTGDLGRLSDTGRLLTGGRHDDCIVTGGEKVATAEVESVLLDQPGVRAAAVVPISDSIWGQIIAAAVVLDDAAEVATALSNIEAAVMARLAPYKRPRRWLSLLELPLLPNGKLDRRALLALFDRPRP